MPVCSYCSSAPDDVWLSSDQAIVLPHPNPIAPGHAVVIPRRHVSTFYALDVVEQKAMWELVKQFQRRIQEGLQVSRFHIGFADSEEARGHAHVHVVPQGPDDDLDLPIGIQWTSE